MAEPKRRSIYPEVTRGALSSDNSRYIHPPQAKGPKMGSMQDKIIIFGIVFFILFALFLALSMGLAKYFDSSAWTV